MIVPAWVHRVRRTLAPVLGPIVGAPYALGLGIVSRRFDRGVGVARLPMPVVSVGNLSTGGTGKTPCVAWLVRELARHGHEPMIAMRGYARTRDGISDEQDEYERLLPGVAIAADPDRAGAIARVLAQRAEQGLPAPSVVVLDDGFQHRQIARDFDIVLIDATRPPGREHLLPLGDLREPLLALRRASAVLLTRCELACPADVRETVESIERVTLRDHADRPAPPVFRARHEWDGVMVSDRAGERHEPETFLAKRALGVVCAIGRGDLFVQRVGRVGRVVFSRVFDDHRDFSAADIDAIAAALVSAQAGALVVTEKDWSKLRRVPGICERLGLPIARPRLTLEIDDSASLLRSVLSAIDARASAAR
jgi:tetraacyldisaccharide 4'-kinase